MASGFDVAKVRLWRERFGRFDDGVHKDGVHQDGRMTIAKFCEAEDISQSSSYYWRRKLRQSKRRTSPTPQKQQQKKSASGSVFKPMTIVAAAMVVIRLPGDILIEVPAGNDGALRAIVGQLVCDQRAATRC